MARKVGLILSLLLLPLWVAGSCGSPGTTGSPGAGGSPDAGPSIDPFQACVEVCIHGRAAPCVFPAPGIDCEAWCARLFENAGPDCQDEVVAEWVCLAPAMEARQDYCEPLPEECFSQSAERQWCVGWFGCSTPHWDEPPPRGCKTAALGPNGEDGCICSQDCLEHYYISECWTEGGTTKCGCYERDRNNPPYAQILVGFCEGGPVCEDALYKGCCNHIYKISL